MRDERLQAVIADFLEQIERGDARGAREFAAQHPDLALELSEFFADWQNFCSAAAAVSAASNGSSKSIAATLPRRLGDYELLETIAQGGMGIVYKARQLPLQRIVAVKMLRAGTWATPADVKRFQSEAAAAAQLDHPGIVPIYEVGEHEGQPFFSMAYVPGESLAQRVAAGPLAPPVAAQLVRDVALALQYAHERGVVRRDLKPANILLEHSSPRITDFGLAKWSADGNSLTRTGELVGTPSYMAPEQASPATGSIGPATDIYSLGAVLYCLLAGRPPFQAAHPLDTFDPKPNLTHEHGKPFPASVDATQFDQNGTCLGSPFRFSPSGKSGLMISELFPHLSTLADDMCVIRSMKADFAEHSQACFHLHCGHPLQGKPSVGSWICYGLGAEHENLPGYVVLNGGTRLPVRCWEAGRSMRPMPIRPASRSIPTM